MSDRDQDSRHESEEERACDVDELIEQFLGSGPLTNEELGTIIIRKTGVNERTYYRHLERQLRRNVVAEVFQKEKDGRLVKKYALKAFAASAAFFFSGLSAIASAKVLKKPLSLIGIVLGAVTLAALGLYSAGIVTSGSLTSNVAYDSGFYLGLGPGGMEHMVVYPALMWLAWFSGHLATQREK